MPSSEINNCYDILVICIKCTNVFPTWPTSFCNYSLADQPQRVGQRRYPLIIVSIPLRLATEFFGWVDPLRLAGGSRNHTRFGPFWWRAFSPLIKENPSSSTATSHDLHLFRTTLTIFDDHLRKFSHVIGRLPRINLLQQIVSAHLNPQQLIAQASNFLSRALTVHTYPTCFRETDLRRTASEIPTWSDRNRVWRTTGEIRCEALTHKRDLHHMRKSFADQKSHMKRTFVDKMSPRRNLHTSHTKMPLATRSHARRRNYRHKFTSNDHTDYHRAQYNTQENVLQAVYDGFCLNTFGSHTFPYRLHSKTTFSFMTNWQSHKQGKTWSLTADDAANRTVSAIEHSPSKCPEQKHIRFDTFVNASNTCTHEYLIFHFFYTYSFRHAQDAQNPSRSIVS